jgi:hypothetical protein
VPQAPLTAQETRLAVFCRLFAVLYFAGGFAFGAFPEWTYRIASAGGDFALSGPEATFWNVLAVAMMTAAATACLVTASRPRERRHAMLPVVVAKLTASALAGAHLLGAGRSPALLAIFVTDAPLLVLTLAVYRSAAPGVRSAAAREAPPAVVEAPPKVQLKLSK